MVEPRLCNPDIAVRFCYPAPCVRSLIGRASDCGSDRYGFKSRRTPQKTYTANFLSYVFGTYKDERGLAQ